LPFRQTFAAVVLWKPLPDGWEMQSPPADHPGGMLPIPHALLEHRPLVLTPELKPISEVDEVYSRENMALTPTD